VKIFHRTRKIFQHLPELTATHGDLIMISID
jgi:hypothetical protein